MNMTAEQDEAAFAALRAGVPIRKIRGQWPESCR